MEVVIRTDASVNIGSGHVMRCLVLAKELSRNGCHVSFACRKIEGDLIRFIAEQGFQVIELPFKTRIEPKDSADYLAWLSCSIADDVYDFLTFVNNADLVITDHYAIGYEWQLQVRQELSCRMLAIDDLNRKHAADFILDQNLWPDAKTRYHTSNQQQLALVGPKYALLRKEFSNLRSSDKTKKNQVLAFFGGSDPTNECSKLIKAAEAVQTLPFKLKIVSGRQRRDTLKISQSKLVTIVEYIDNFDEELQQSKYCIGASGVSNWERFCLNIPSTIVSVADNQKALSEYLFELGAVRYLGRGNSTTVSTYIKELKYLADCWSDIKSCSSYIVVDGLGVERVVETVLRGNGI